MHYIRMAASGTLWMARSLIVSIVSAFRTVKNGEFSHHKSPFYVAKTVFEEIFEHNVDPAVYVEEKGLKVVNDEGALKTTIEGILAANPQSVADYKSGKEKALGFLVGQTMKAMKGKADPGMVNKLLKELLAK